MSSTLTDADVAAIRARAEAATSGPWRHYRNKLRPNFGGIINEVQCRSREPIVQWGGFDNSNRPEKKHAANAAFIAHARTDIPALLADRDALRAERDELLEELARVILACPMSPETRTRPADIGVRELRSRYDALLARAETAGADYQETIERLQALCEKHGCEPGSNRFDWLDERLTALTTAHTEAADDSEAMPVWPVAWLYRCKGDPRGELLRVSLFPVSVTGDIERVKALYPAEARLAASPAAPQSGEDER